MGLKRNSVFWGLLVLEIAAVFVLDYHHEAEQDVYNGPFIESARSLWATGTYALDGEAAFYPMWGYPVLVLLCGFSPVIVLVAQGALCFGAVGYLYATLRIQPRYFHIPLMLPFFALCSIKWPNAITGVLLVIFICSFSGHLDKPRFKTMLIGGLAAGLAVNMRGEAWIWVPVLFLSLIFPMGPGMRAKGARFGVAVIIIQLLCISPWAIRAYTQLGSPRLTPTHGGGLALVSLGQYPDNPWGVKNTDSYIHAFAEKRGLGSPYSPAADIAMRNEFIALIAANPAAFARKVFHNLAGFFHYGVFAGQVFTLTLTEADYWKAFGAIKANGVVAALKELPPSTSMPVLLHLGMDYLFRAGWLLLLLATVAIPFDLMRKGEPVPPMAALSIAFTLGTVAVVSLLYYEPRHVSFLWLPLAASLLLMTGGAADDTA